MGVSLLSIPLVYALFNFIYASVSIPLGSLSDKIGREKVILLGWFSYAVAYLGFALSSHSYQIWFLFGLYGVYYATTEGVAKAYIADLVVAKHRGKAYGIYNAAIGLITLPASLIAGLLWDKVTPAAPFYFGAGTALGASVVLLLSIRKKVKIMRSNLQKRTLFCFILVLLLISYGWFTFAAPKNTGGQVTGSIVARVLPNAVQPSVFISPSSVIVRVTHVIDGDTIEIEGGITVRYIGIDAPELHDPRRNIQCFSQESYQKNKTLVEGKAVRLVKDISETDKFGRLLRYVWIDNVLVNEQLVKEGYAFASSYPPDIANQELFQQTQEEARENQRGLWNKCKLGK